MKKLARVIGLGLLGWVVAGCSTTPKPAYVSMTKYQNLSCAQLLAEHQRIETHLRTGVEPKRSTGVGVGVGVGGGWGHRSGWGIGPTVSVNLGQWQTSKKTEIAQLLGEQEAIAQAAQYKRCPVIAKKPS